MLQHPFRLKPVSRRKIRLTHYWMCYILMRNLFKCANGENKAVTSRRLCSLWTKLGSCCFLFLVFIFTFSCSHFNQLAAHWQCGTPHCSYIFSGMVSVVGPHEEGRRLLPDRICNRESADLSADFGLIWTLAAIPWCSWEWQLCWLRGQSELMLCSLLIILK